MSSADTQLSAKYRIRDLNVTNQALSQPNLPSSGADLQNLKYLADQLEKLEYYIGPFQIKSGFRTHELQLKLGESGAPVSSGKSFHEVGRAVDIYPTTMTMAEFFARMLKDDHIRRNYAEIAYKPSQGTLHLAINVPGDTRNPRISGLDPVTNGYQVLSSAAIQSIIAPYMSLDEAESVASAAGPAMGLTPYYLGAAVALGLLFLV